MALTQLIYVSTAAGEFGDEVLDAILAASRRRNAEEQLTGMLLYSRGTFMQVLEGEDEVLDATLARIKADPRHHGVFVLSREAIEQQEFLSWSMAFRRLSVADGARHPGFAPFFAEGFDAARLGIHPGIALDLLRQFSRT